MVDKDNSPVMLYDGVCGFCNQTVQTIIKLDKTGKILFAPLQSEFGKAVVERHPELAQIDSVILLEKLTNSSERILVRSDAIITIARHIGGIWRLAQLTSIIPRALRDFFYDLFAKNRYKVFGKYDSYPRNSRSFY
jgi:predicted DCC family thiol-disulfide oxidoreductase YuxK